MNLYIIPSLMMAIAGVVGYQDNEFFTFEPGDAGAEINLYTGETGKPISRYLYGKFTEHLGRNIYGGMWAQILHNPGFEAWHFWGSDFEDAKRRMNHYARSLGVSNIMENRDAGIAFWWLAYGNGDIIYELDADSFNSEQAQKITVNSLKSQQAGIRQIMFLPLHRERNYELSFYARSHQPCKLHLAVRETSGKERALAANDIDISSDDWRRYALKLGIRETVEKGAPLMLTIGLSEPATVWLDQMALFPEDNVKGFDPDVIEFTRESQLPILRYPGGNFASGYHWKDGIGPIDERKSTKNRAWNMIEYNHVGADEFMNFCEAAGADPLICVNAGDGSPEEAAEWVEYCNGGVNTKFGALRAENGHSEPYDVVYWEIGNELYGNWQIGHCTPEEYAERYEEFYRAMTAVDPAIKIIANGQDLRWNAPIVQRKSNILRSLSTHTLIGGGTPEDIDPTEVFESLMAYTHSYADHLREMGAQMAEGVKEPILAVTELQIFTNKPGQPNNATLSESLFWSGIVNSCIRTGGLVEMITHSALVNHGGGLRKEREIVYANPVYYARKLYSTQSCTVPVRAHIRCPMYRSSGRYSPATDVPYLDAVALIDDESNKLSLIITNRHSREALDTHISLHDFNPSETVNIQTLAGNSYMSRNGWDRPDEIKLQETDLRINSGELDYSVPAHSIVLLVFRRERG